MGNEYKANSSRYDRMLYRRVGNSGLKFPIISLGFWHNFGSYDSYDNMKALCHTAFDIGVTQFDLANNYGPEYGSAEENLGKILKDSLSPYRDELVITTKGGYDMWPGPYGNYGSKKYLVSSLNQSLKRLGLEYVDIFYHHRMDKETPLEESMEALAFIVRSGKALYAGISNYDAAYTKRAVEIMRALKCPLIVNQLPYSLFNRSIEDNNVKRVSREEGVGIIAFSPLAQGLLSSRYLNGIPADSRISKNSRFLKKEVLTEKRVEQIKQLNELALERDQTLAQMALSWVLQDSNVSSVLIGASRPEQIVENAQIVNNLEFTKEELEKIDSITKN